MTSIAIIGTGISGMGAGYLLHRAGYHVTVYEKSPVIGGHSRTVTVDYDGLHIPVDTGFIVYNIPNYPHLSAMFAHLNVPVQKSDMTFAITVDGGRMEWGARDVNAVFGQRRNLLRPRFWRMIAHVMRFNSQAAAAVARLPSLTIGGLLAELDLGRDFMRYYLLPMCGAIWSCPPKAMLDFPAATLVRFFMNHGLMAFTGQPQWYTVSGGSKEYVKRLTSPYLEHIRTGCGVREVMRENGRVQVTDEHGERREYDRVVFACHADQTLAMLKDATPEERAVLGAFSYQRNMAYLHRDESLMPKRKRCWASWVYHADSRNQAIGDEADISVTYWMNLLQTIDHAKPLFVTLNPAREIPKSLLFDVHEFEHPVFTQAAIDAQAKIPGLQGQRQSWFCGAYTRYGFHEDGLLSAVNVAKSMGVEIPWH